MEQNPPKIDWLHGTPREAVAEYALWLDAVVSAEIPKGAEVGGNLKPLIDLLRSDHIPKPEARAAIADLLSRHRLARLPGKQATPHRRKHRRRKGPEDKAVLAANLKPLIELLRNPARVLGPNARADIADLLSRHRLMRLPYRPSAPRYGTTLAEGRMDMLAIGGIGGNYRRMRPSWRLCGMKSGRSWELTGFMPTSPRTSCSTPSLTKS
jgi:hypothetical protein